MNTFRTAVSVIIMVIAGIVGLFLGSLLDMSPAGGAILFALIAGIACIIYTIDNNRNNNDDNNRGE